jgi:RNA polymerase sigma-70 factor (ECF subfamily)
VDSPPTQALDAEGPASAGAEDDARVVEALLAGDETVFEELVNRHHEAMVRLALTFVRTRAVAEEVAQETWLAVLGGISRFEGRSSLKTWIFRILANQAKTRGARERRTVPLSALVEEGGPAVDPDRFFPQDHPAYPGDWAAPPRRWDDIPEERLLGKEVEAELRAAIAKLPAGQRAVITLRDVEGFDADQVCELLDLTEGNQRVLLHRARARVRANLEQYIEEAV